MTDLEFRRQLEASGDVRPSEINAFFRELHAVETSEPLRAAHVTAAPAPALTLDEWTRAFGAWRMGQRGVKGRQFE